MDPFMWMLLGGQGGGGGGGNKFSVPSEEEMNQWRTDFQTWLDFVNQLGGGLLGNGTGDANTPTDPPDPTRVITGRTRLSPAITQTGDPGAPPPTPPTTPPDPSAPPRGDGDQGTEDDQSAGLLPNVGRGFGN